MSSWQYTIKPKQDKTKKNNGKIRNILGNNLKHRQHKITPREYKIKPRQYKIQPRQYQIKT